jgi:hypothetical protein
MAGIPQSTTAGTTLALSLALTAYPAPDWSASLILRGAQSIDLASQFDGKLHTFTATADVTAAWKPGDYWYSLRVTDGDNVHEVETGTLTVDPDLAAMGEFDGRTHAERTLQAIEAVIEGRASRDQDSYRINNRELRRTPISQLLKLRDVYRQEVRRLRASRRGKDTLGRQVLARFNSHV